MSAVVHPTLVVAAVLAAGVAAVYLYVGRMLWSRPAQVEARKALLLFATWWIATGINILMGSAINGAAGFGWTQLALQTAYAVMQRLLLCVALVGLLYYLLFLVRGRAPLAPLCIVYGLYFLYLVASMYRNDPVGVFVGDWRTDLEFAQPDTGPGLSEWLSFAVLIVPTVGLSIVALVVARRLPASQEAQRNRMTLVSLALIIWWIVAVVAGQRQTLDADWYQIFNRILDLGMALLILFAYRPPAWLRQFIVLPFDGAEPEAAVPQKST